MFKLFEMTLDELIELHKIGQDIMSYATHE